AACAATRSRRCSGRGPPPRAWRRPARACGRRSCSAGRAECGGLCRTYLFASASALLETLGERRLDGIDDGLEARTSAVVARQKGTDFLAALRLLLGEQFGRRHQHAGRTKPALQRVAADERGLQVGDLAGVGKPLDGDDLGAVGL